LTGKLPTLNRRKRCCTNLADTSTKPTLDSAMEAGVWVRQDKTLCRLAAQVKDWGLAHRSKNPTLVPPSTRKDFADGGVSRSVAKRQIVACRELAPPQAKVADAAKQDSTASMLQRVNDFSERSD